MPESILDVLPLVNKSSGKMHVTFVQHKIPSDDLKIVLMMSPIIPPEEFGEPHADDLVNAVTQLVVAPKPTDDAVAFFSDDMNRLIQRQYPGKDNLVLTFGLSSGVVLITGVWDYDTGERLLGDVDV